MPGPVPGRGPAVEKHWSRPASLIVFLADTEGSMTSSLEICQYNFVIDSLDLLEY